MKKKTLFQINPMLTVEIEDKKTQFIRLIIAHKQHKKIKFHSQII